MTRITTIGKATGLALLALGAAAPAFAADLGGNCCADLEERIAELEATTARKGNRKVSLSISGYVSHSIMWWDDGGQKDMYIGDGGAVSSRFRFTGTAKINPDLTAGFLYEFGANNNALGSTNQLNGGDDLGGAVTVRDTTVWLSHKTLGKIKIGHGSTATDNLILADVSGAGSVLTPDVGLFIGGFSTRVDTLTINGVSVPVGGALTGITWAQMLNGGISFDTARRNHVFYETPSLAGFTLSAAVAENSFWDVALRYAGEFGGFRMAGGIGYSVDKEQPAFGVLALTAAEIKELKGSVSIMHVGTGLFVNGAYGQRDINWAVTAFGHTLSADDPKFWHIAVGWSRNVTGWGNTVLFGEYLKADDFLAYSLTGPIFNGSITSDASMWGLGLVQHVDAAAMEIFLSWRTFKADAQLTGSGNGGSLAIDAQLHDFQSVVGGVRIQF